MVKTFVVCFYFLYLENTMWSNKNVVSQISHEQFNEGDIEKQKKYKFIMGHSEFSTYVGIDMRIVYILV